MTADVVRLADGRNMGYTLYGPPTGQPVVYFHGTPSSRLELLQLQHYGLDLQAKLRALDLCIIAVDRPGMGLSDLNPKGDFLSCAADTAYLLRQLKVDQCPVLCWSGGGPYALALASQYPELIPQVGILCGFSRQFVPAVQRQMYASKWYFRAAASAPGLVRRIMLQICRRPMHNAPPQFLTSLANVDYELLNHSDRYRAMMRYSFQEACRQGAAGPVHEAALYLQPFGFALTDVQQPVHYWWGTEDRLVTKAHADAVAQLPNGTMHYMEGEGHISVFVRCFVPALKTLTGATVK